MHIAVIMGRKVNILKKLMAYRKQEAAMSAFVFLNIDSPPCSLFRTTLAVLGDLHHHQGGHRRQRHDSASIYVEVSLKTKFSARSSEHLALSTTVPKRCTALARYPEVPDAPTRAPYGVLSTSYEDPVRGRSPTSEVLSTRH
jgi:hypothetical protein